MGWQNRQVHPSSDVSEHHQNVSELQDGMRDGEPSFCPQHQPEWSAFREASFGHVSKGCSCDIDWCQSCSHSTSHPV